MKVSVLIAAYNAGPYLETALESVRGQTFGDWELVVVEDGSRDETENMVARFASAVSQRVHYQNLLHNQGVGTVRTRLLELATGEVLAFLDADDTWEPTHLANLIAKIEVGADLVVSGVQTFDLTTRRPLAKVSVPAALLDQPVLTLFQESVIITSSSVGFTRALATRTGQFDATLRIGEDRDYWLRCGLEGARFAFTHAFTCNYAKHDGSSMARTAVVAEQELRFYEKYRALAEVPARLRRHCLASSLIALGRLLRGANPQQSACYLRQALRYEPLSLRILAHLALSRWRVFSLPRVA